MELHQISLTSAVGRIRSGEISALEYSMALVERAHAFSALNAFTYFDPERLLDAARQADQCQARGEALARLHGVPLAIKDSIDIEGLPTSGGTPVLRDNIVRRTAPMIRSLFDAGALCFGKTNLYELAFGITSNNRHTGAVRNPCDPERSAGGSSGGSAAAVAAGMVPAAIGSDTAGSVRIPAAHCGILGFRPSHGRYDSTGFMPLFPSRDAPGVMARSVEDLFLIDSVLTGEWQVPVVELRGLRIGVPGDHFLKDLQGDIAEAVEGEFRRLEGLGAILVEAEAPDFAAMEREAAGPIREWELFRSLDAYLQGCGNGIGLDAMLSGIADPDLREEFLFLRKRADDAGQAERYRQAVEVTLPRCREEYSTYLRENGLAAMAFPTTPHGPPLLGEEHELFAGGKAFPIWHMMRNTVPATFLAAPGVTVPFARNAEGLPIGLEFDGMPGRDRELLAVAAARAREG